MKNSKSCKGCVTFLVIFLSEHTTVMQPNHVDIFPRFLKWSLPSVAKSLSKMNLKEIDSDKVNDCCLQLTSEEQDFMKNQLFFNVQEDSQYYREMYSQDFSQSEYTGHGSQMVPFVGENENISLQNVRPNCSSSIPPDETSLASQAHEEISAAMNLPIVSFGKEKEDFQQVNEQMQFSTPIATDVINTDTGVLSILLDLNQSYHSNEEEIDFKEKWEELNAVLKEKDEMIEKLKEVIDQMSIAHAKELFNLRKTFVDENALHVDDVPQKPFKDETKKPDTIPRLSKRKRETLNVKKQIKDVVVTDIVEERITRSRKSKLDKDIEDKKRQDALKIISEKKRLKKLPISSLVKGVKGRQDREPKKKGSSHIWIKLKKNSSKKTDDIPSFSLGMTQLEIDESVPSLSLGISQDVKVPSSPKSDTPVPSPPKSDSPVRATTKSDTPVPSHPKSDTPVISPPKSVTPVASPPKVSSPPKTNKVSSQEVVLIHSDIKLKPSTKVFKEIVFPKKSYVVQNLPAEVIEKMHKINRSSKGDLYFWSDGEGSNVYFNDLEPIWLTQYISSMIVDAWALILLDLQNQQHLERVLAGQIEIGSSFFVNSQSWAYLKVLKDGSSISKFYLNYLDKAKSSNARFVQFPIVSSGRNSEASANHWTLLVYDVPQNLWIFHNSIIPRGGGIDYWFLEAKKVAQHAHDYWHSLSGDKTKKKLTFHYVAKNPQQTDNECAIFVMKAMKCYVTGEIIPEKWLPKEIYDMKIEVISSIILDHRSIQECDLEAYILSENVI